MHFEVLSEDISGKKFLDIIIPKIIGNKHTFEVKHYKGVGRIPKNLQGKSNPAKRILLAELPKLLRGYGKTYDAYPDDYSAAVILVCDLDDKNLDEFRKQLMSILDTCDPKPETRFCIAIEEGEAWLLGDIPAIKKAYPDAKNGVLNAYENDSICGTWEKLADAVHSGGSQKLKPQGYRASGMEKSNWAVNITPHMDIDNNKSPSFCDFRDQLRSLI
ncbi:MAG: hypothetical protein BA863_11375 [Desulfovibrio sp. S3730MH75]|nr:MAG: hypothetical protein BA863_11375 [Desulfovibrio sp. S3730MH75]